MIEEASPSTSGVCESLVALMIIEIDRAESSGSVVAKIGGARRQRGEKLVRAKIMAGTIDERTDADIRNG